MAVLIAAIAAGCGGAPSPSPTFLAGVPSPGCGAVCGSPNVGVACVGVAAPLAELAQVESQVKAGSISDEAAEGVISTIQGALVDQEQAIGLSAPLAQSIQGVVSSLGELGVALNQNQPTAQLASPLAAVDGAVANLATACRS